MDFTYKAWWVKGGDWTPNSVTSRDVVVFWRNNIHIVLVYLALHGIDVMAADIRNAYVKTTSLERHYIICGLQFYILNEGKIALICCDLYGGNVSRRNLWRHLHSYMKQPGFELSRADSDIWFRLSNSKNDKEILWVCTFVHRWMHIDIGQRWRYSFGRISANTLCSNRIQLEKHISTL